MEQNVPNPLFFNFALYFGDVCKSTKSDTYFSTFRKIGCKIERFWKAIAKNQFSKNKGNLYKGSKFFEHVLLTEQDIWVQNFEACYLTKQLLIWSPEVIKRMTVLCMLSQWVMAKFYRYYFTSKYDLNCWLIWSTY